MITSDLTSPPLCRKFTQVRSKTGYQLAFWRPMGLTTHQPSQLQLPTKGGASIPPEHILFSEDFRGLCDEDREKAVFERLEAKGFHILNNWPTYQTMKATPWKTGERVARMQRLAADQYHVPSFEDGHEIQTPKCYEFLQRMDKEIGNLDMEMQALGAFLEDSRQNARAAEECLANGTPPGPAVYRPGQCMAGPGLFRLRCCASHD
ncbi:hypothetical protein VTN77DRAFT_7426 [Rasamsonia byssochlamydoides]|uniref:uncharacterized protein n=1 Tax=Rasamsonia byssochlamydoides TaxID=89139 RepID=UPI00374399A6